MTELATNLLKHAKKGCEVLIGVVGETDRLAVEIISLDAGPGMAAPLKMMEDGVSTSGSLGGGLGAIKRLSDEFDIFSRPGAGTVVLSRVFPPNYKQVWNNEVLNVAGITVALPGESVSGDRWGVRTDGTRAMLVLVDGLGHGAKAAYAAEKALQVALEEE